MHQIYYRDVDGLLVKGVPGEAPVVAVHRDRQARQLVNYILQSAGQLVHYILQSAGQMVHYIIQSVGQLVPYILQ